MTEIPLGGGPIVKYEKGDVVRLTKQVVPEGETGRIYEANVYVNGKRFTSRSTVPASTPVDDAEVEYGQFIYAPQENVIPPSVYDIAGPGLSSSDILALKRIAAMLPQNAICVNIGANIGTSTIAVLEERADVFVFSIDTKPCKDEFRNLEWFGLAHLHRVVRVLGRSQEVGINWPYPIDFLFVDGAHRYADVVGDIKAWVPKVKSGGIVAFHDYGTQHTPGVKKAVDELMGGYKVIAYMEVLIAFKV